jgi:WD40 repeat protein
MRHEGFVESARFSPDGKRVVTASDDHTARIWDGFWPLISRTEGLITEVCQRKLRGAARQITEVDGLAGKVLSRQRIGEDVCDGVLAAGAP